MGSYATVKLRRRVAIVLLIASAIVIAGIVAVLWVVPRFLELLVTGDSKDLRANTEGEPAKPGEPTVLLLAIDGVDRRLLYDMLRRNELPHLAGLLGGIRDGELPHAYLDDTALAPLPSSTMTSWATIFTGEPPARHGVAGNEYFIRAERRLAAPAPVSVFAPDVVLQSYTDGYANDLLGVPTLYERLRRGRHDLSIWVAMSPYHRGADRLLLANRTVIADAFKAFLDDDDEEDDLDMFAELDEEVVENVIEELEDEAAPHVLTLYLAGADYFAHGSKRGPDEARRHYLTTIFDPLVGELAAALDRRGARRDRYVVVVSDHGQTEVLHDDVHALGTSDEPDEPPAIVRAAGYRLRPFELDVDEDHDFDTVLAYGGALAYVYLADRSTCPRARDVCDWTRPPRFREDVAPLAEAFRAQPWIDLVLVRRDGAFAVYTGGGETEPIDAHLAAHPRPEYIEVASRLRDLAVGPRGDHAGDILLVAKNGAEPDAGRRFYFSGRYHSWHGSPSRSDSEIPLIVAHPRRTAADLRRTVRAIAGAETAADEVTDIIEHLMTSE
ncbi:MAG: alkaline phosphatase family protein [Deltaproteobacteria bacterium]|nr:alkaline phosphatase family protein [Kofleriaceae bacterium]